MSLVLVAAKAARMRKQAGLRLPGGATKLEAGIGGTALGAGGLIGAQQLGAFAKTPEEIPADALGTGATKVPAGVSPTPQSPVGQGLVERHWNHTGAGWAPPAEGDLSTFANRKAAGKMKLRDELREGANNTVGTGIGNLLKRWYGTYAGRGQQ